MGGSNGVGRSKHRRTKIPIDNRSQVNASKDKQNKKGVTSSGIVTIVQDISDRLTYETNNNIFNNSRSNEQTTRKITRDISVIEDKDIDNNQEPDPEAKHYIESEIKKMNGILKTVNKGLIERWNKNQNLKTALLQSQEMDNTNLDEYIVKIQKILNTHQKDIEEMNEFRDVMLRKYRKKGITVVHNALQDIQVSIDDYQITDKNIESKVKSLSESLGKKKNKMQFISNDIDTTLQFYDDLLRRLSQLQQLQGEPTEIEIINKGKHLTEQASSLLKENNSIIELLKSKHSELAIQENKESVDVYSVSMKTNMLELLKQSPSKKKDIQQYLEENKENIDNLQLLKSKLQYNNILLNEIRSDLIVINKIQSRVDVVDVELSSELKTTIVTTIQDLEDKQLSLIDAVNNIDDICRSYQLYELEKQKISEEIEPVHNLLNKIQDISSKFTKMKNTKKIAAVFIVILVCVFSALLIKGILPLFVFIIAFIVLAGVTVALMSKINDDDKQAALAFTKNLTDNFLCETYDIDKKLALEQISQVLDCKDYYKAVKQFRIILLDKCADFFAADLDQPFPEKYQLITEPVNKFLKEVFSFVRKNFPDEYDQNLQEAKKAYLLKMFTDNSIIESFIEDITLHNIRYKQKQQKKFNSNINFSDLDRLHLIHNINLGILIYFKEEFPTDTANIEKIRGIRQQQKQRIDDLEKGKK
jgi:allophanate hydrolase subunit 1